MPNTLVPIYILRSQCKKHALDTMRTFTLKGNESPDEAYSQMEAHITRTWPTEHRCSHKVKFTRETDKYHRYNTETKQAVEI
jgi:hypothetical protein